MPILRLIERRTYGPRDVRIMTEAFEEALRLADVSNRASIISEMIAVRIIDEFQKGEINPKRIAAFAAGN